MYNGTTVSLKTILWKVMNHPLAAELTYDLAAEYAIEGIKLIGTPLSLVNKVSDPIQIVSYKAALPIDIVDLKSIRGMVNKDDHEREKIALTRATDLFHNNDCKTSCNTLLGYNATYVAEAGVVKTGFDEGYIEVAYTSLPVDDEGFPLIPNNQKVLLAIEFYILDRFLFPIWSMGKLTDKVYHAIEQKKSWYMGAANTNMQLQSYDHVESMMNSINRILLNSNAHKNFFKGASTKERLKRH